MVGPGGYLGYVYYGVNEHIPNQYVGMGTVYWASG